jgi:transcription elongation GreA/GreB family factor
MQESSMNIKNIKSKLQSIMLQQIETQMQSLERALMSIEESKRNETKSSAGDKFETGRAMMQREQDKMEAQKSQLMTTKNHLRQISPGKECTHGEVGALISTGEVHYYISVGIGKMIIEGEVYYAISPDAPLSKLMINKRVGEQVRFRDRKFQILEVQ